MFCTTQGVQLAFYAAVAAHALEAVFAWRKARRLYTTIQSSPFAFKSISLALPLRKTPIVMDASRYSTVWFVLVLILGFPAFSFLNAHDRLLAAARLTGAISRGPPVEPY